MHSHAIVQEIDRTLPQTPRSEGGGSLLAMVGLPGAGKSYLVQHLLRRVPATVLTTDRIRRIVREQPTYSAAEMAWIYELCYRTMERRLSLGERVVFDASNYLALRRERLVEIAARHDVPLALCCVQASEAVTRQRLLRRVQGRRSPGDASDAGWSVYRRMLEAQEPVTLPHLFLDTSHTPVDILAERLHDYWMHQEESHRHLNDTQTLHKCADLHKRADLHKSGDLHAGAGDGSGQGRLDRRK